MRKGKRKCKRNHLEKIDEELKNRQQHIPSTTITIEPDGTSAFNGVLNLKNMNISSPDLMLPNHTFEEDYEDETSPLNGLKLDSNVSHHSALTQRFVNLKNYRDLLSDTLHDNESIYEYKDNDMSSNYMSPRTKSFNERMSSVTVLGTISPTVKSIVEFSDRKALIENELINTEESYLNGLKILLNEFIKPIFKQQLIDRKFEKQITCNLPQLICFHEQFLKELYVGPISKVFNKQSDYFKIYISYISEYENILNLFGVFRKKNKKLEEFLTEKRLEQKPLTNHLILPIQRIPRYMLLLTELKKNTPCSNYKDYKDIEIALEKVTEICNEINEKQREIENLSQCLQITENLKHLNINIVEPQRKYINHFIFKRKRDDRNRQFFIFNDIIIIANGKWDTKRVIKLVKFEAKRPSVNINEVLINIIDIDNEPISYISTNNIPDKDKHENVSNIDLFCEIVNKYRDQLYENGMSRKKRVGNSQQLSLELIEMEIMQREKEDEEKLKQYKQKGDKQKVLTMLGGE